jgi:hypothetical protein
MIKRIVFFLVVLSVFSKISAQNFIGFTKNMAHYPDDIRDMFGPNSTKEDDDFLTNFSVDWRKNVYDSLEKKKIWDLSVLLYNNKGRVPQFKPFLQLIATFKETDNEENKANYIAWTNYMSEYLTRKKVLLSSINVIFESIINLLKDNSVVKTNTIQWQYKGNGYKFKTEKETFCIVFQEGDLECYSKRDSLGIEKTSGTYYPLEKKWVGKGGEVTWERAGFQPGEVNVQLKNYIIEMSKTEYKADSVVFTYGKYFKKPILGQLIDKVMNIQSPESSAYPEFNSYSKRFVFKDLYPNVDYDGGFSMRGAKIIGSGNESEDAKIFIKKGNKILMEVHSKFFVFRPQKINGINTSIKIHLEQDSIYHSDLSFIYFADKQEVNLLRTENYASRSPYYNSYHKLDMDFEQLTWKIDQPTINLTMSKGASIGNARFESTNFFNQSKFEELQGRDAFHPLVELRKFSKKIGSDHFMGDIYADYVGRSLNEVRQVLMSMAQKGYIYYNSESDVVTIKQRLVDCLKSAAGSIDYDVVSFNSTTQAPQDNATLDMNNFDLIIHGISQIAVSDSQNVAIFPAHDQITMKENRSFQFDGKVIAGQFTVYGSNFFFDYTNFKINLQNVDSVSITVFTGERDNFGRPVIKTVKNVIQHLTGELRIDKSNNKSGLKNYPEYPLFASRENSFVYYQSPEIENGVYPKDKFNFELYPFEIDSLDNFRKEGMNFRGKFRSAGILPDIEKQLVLQPDYSLGFKFNSGTEGIPVYDGKGKLFADIQLSNKGLRANGKLSYLTSTTSSRDFKFYPDSMNTQSDQFAMERKTDDVQFPRENSVENYIHWVTVKDNRMTIKQGKGPFHMFNEKTSLTGGLVLAPEGLSGKGMMNLTTADLKSESFKYKAEIIDADTARFLLKSLRKEGYTVLTEENVNAHIDFSLQKGEFVANEDYTKVEFPENKYISYLDYFKWNMDAKTLEMTAKRTVAMGATTRTDKAKFEERFRFEEENEGPRYISTHSKQDSLNFVAPSAVYDYQNNLINAFDVKLIRVADAIIYTKDGKVTVAEAAQMKTVYGATIVANNKDRYHTIYAADVNIQGRKSFTGSGKYDYVDEAERKQVVAMHDIKVDEDLHTTAQGNVLETDSFTLSPYFNYQGKITLNSSKALLNFDGGVNIKAADCDRLKSSWLKFNSEIDPKNILIPVSQTPVSINNKPLYSGIFLAPDSIHIYPAFLSGRRGYNDKLISTSSGFLRFNKDSMLYEIASLEKLAHRDSIGSYLSFHPTTCIEYGEGKINLGIDLGQMKLNSYGSVSMNVQTREVLLDIMLDADFMFDATAMKMMASRIDSFPNLTGVDINDPLLIRSWTESLGIKRTDKYREEMSLLGKPKEFPAELQHTTSLKHLKLKWDQETKSYQSYEKMGVGNVLDNQVNKLVDGFVQISKKRTSDVMDIYLKMDDKNFYYFGYTRGVMQSFSSNSSFVEALRKLPIKVRQMDVKRGETPYIYMVTSDTRFSNFLRDYRRLLKKQSQSQEQEQLDQQQEQAAPVTAPVNSPDEPKEKTKTEEKAKTEENPPANTNTEKPKEDEVIEVK